MSFSTNTDLFQKDSQINLGGTGNRVVHGTVWHSMAVLGSMAQHEAAWHSTAKHGKASWHSRALRGAAWHGMDLLVFQKLSSRYPTR